MTTSKAVSLLSGGLDSATLLYQLQADGYQVHALSFNYGQRHSRELEFAQRLAAEANVEHQVIWLGYQEGTEGFIESLAPLLKGSSLTDSSVAVPHGHYAEDSMKQTVVPNRNAIMLSIAYGVAVADGADLVAFAAHAGDHAIYPDCRPDFVEALGHALSIGNEWANPRPELAAPFIHMSKAQIADLATDLELPIELTWSCYEGGDIHCGRCGTCVERQEAFAEAHLKDPTTYRDPNFWRDAVAKAETANALD